LQHYLDYSVFKISENSAGVSLLCTAAFTTLKQLFAVSTHKARKGKFYIV